MTERVLFVHAHPDDESISTGATIATLIEGGAQVTVLTCTRGELGDVIPADLKHLLGSPELGDYREGELAAALTALGVSDHRMLGSEHARWEGRAPRRYLDSGMRWGARGAEPAESVDAGSLTAAELGEVAADIAAVMLAVEPDVVVSYDVDGGYGHPDHIRAHEATRTAAEVIGVPFYVIRGENAPATLVVDGAPVLDRKRAALAAHRTQLVVDGDSYSLSSGDPRPIAAAERFSRLRPDAPGWAQYGIGSRIAASVLAGVLGAFVGVVLTVAHGASVGIGAVPVPWGIVVGIVIAAAVLVGLRLVFETRVVALCAAVGLVAASAFLTLQGPGGSLLVTAGPIGYTWAFAPVVIGLIVLLWPQRRRAAPSSPRAGQAQGEAAPNDKIESVPAAKGPDPL